MSSGTDLTDNDSLHVLPLSMIPLKVKGLQKTRLIKNTRLEGIVELYSEGSIGSGLVMPDALEKVFDFSGDRDQDLTIVKKLAKLPSYDVYSLRVQLRELNIEVDKVESLQLSAEMADSLLEHMNAFTRPLVTKIYGDSNVNAGSFRDVLMLFTDPNADVARLNLRKLSDSLGIKLIQIPMFLEDYADVFLSLSFYQKCHDDTAPDVDAFTNDLNELARSPHLNGQTSAADNIETVANRIRSLHGDIANVIELFRVRTEDMWQNMSSERYRKMTELVTEHQVKIGAILCAITVKLSAWEQKKMGTTTESVSEKVSFVTRDIGYGLDGLSGLEFQDV